MNITVIFKNNSYYTIKTRLYLSLLKSVFTTTKSQTPIPSIFAKIWDWKSVGMCPRKHWCLPKPSLSLYIELEPLTHQKLATSASLINQPCTRESPANKSPNILGLQTTMPI